MMEISPHRRWLSHTLVQGVALVVIDIAIVWVSTLLAYWVRFGGAVGERFFPSVNTVSAAAAIVFVLTFWVAGLYRHVWRYAGVDTFLKLTFSMLFGLALLVSANLVIESQGGGRIAPLGVLILTTVFVGLGTGTIRAFGRLVAYAESRTGSNRSRRILILGAGDAGSLLLRDIETQPDLGLHAVGFLDDDPAKKGRLLRGVPVLGDIKSLASQIPKHRIDEVWVALPSASQAQRRGILDVCAFANIPTRITSSFARNQATLGVSDFRRVSIEDLLGRDAVEIDVDTVANALNGKVVLVTGAAGSIGSELCRQIIRFGPAKLLLLDVDESRLYETYLELRLTDPDSPQMCMGDIRNARKIDAIFAAERPDIVIHAAAYKHVPLMEISPDEAVMANVLGTRNLLNASELYPPSHFCLISTDKAVDPLNVMGLTKAIAEQLMLDACSRGLRGCAVRFGNVLGSRGSVVPLFEEQLRRGGPVYVTHPEVTRYFMTISEAARLVLQAQSISRGGEIYVLDMGEPVRIVDLARKMIVLSGVQADIEFTGLRPAEKLHEILTRADENLIDTGREKIMSLSALRWVRPGFSQAVDDLILYAEIDDRDNMKEAFVRIMPRFGGHGSNEIGDRTPTARRGGSPRRPAL